MSRSHFPWIRSYPCLILHFSFHTFNSLVDSLPGSLFSGENGLKGAARRQAAGEDRSSRPRRRRHPRTSGPATPATAHAWPRQSHPREPRSPGAGFRAPPPPHAQPGLRRSTPCWGSPARGGRQASRRPRSEPSAHTLTMLAALREKREGPALPCACVGGSPAPDVQRAHRLVDGERLRMLSG